MRRTRGRPGLSAPFMLMLSHPNFFFSKVDEGFCDYGGGAQQGAGAGTGHVTRANDDANPSRQPASAGPFHLHIHLPSKSSNRPAPPRSFFVRESPVSDCGPRSPGFPCSK